MPHAEPVSKPRRGGLFAPFLLLLLAIGAWSVAWFWLSGQVTQRMDARAAAAKAQGGELSWQDRTVSGFPFRIDVNLTTVRIADPSGWALSAPEIRAEAYPYALNHWVMAAPRGVVLQRPAMGGPGQPVDGPVTVTGQALRASVVMQTGAPFPRISVEGANLAFATPAGAAPFWIQGLDHLEFHLRPGPNDQGALLLRLDGAKPRLSGLMARIAEDKPVQLVWDSTFTKASELTGADWPAMVRNWSKAGGRLSVAKGSQIVAGQALLAAESGDLGVDPGGRLTGHLDTELREAPRALAAMGQTGAVSPDVATVAAVAAAAQTDRNQTFKALLLFEDGMTKLGPLPLTDAPRVY
jgi:hypothetical protein